MLKIEKVDVFYGNIRALSGLNFDVKSGEIVTLIGANGAGKSTTLRTISGLIRAKAGRVLFFDEDISKRSVEAIVARGISHVPEGRRIFPGLTVYGNLEVATSPWRKRGERIDKELENVFRLFPRLLERRDQLGWSLSGGEQQMLAMARGLMSRPRLLLLDEPSLGLAPMLVQTVFDAVRAINQQETTILLVEQNAYAALQIANRGYVLQNGEITLSGVAQDLAVDENVKKAYLGG